MCVCVSLGTSNSSPQSGHFVCEPSSSSTHQKPFSIGDGGKLNNETHKSDVTAKWMAGVWAGVQFSIKYRMRKASERDEEIEVEKRIYYAKIYQDLTFILERTRKKRKFFGVAFASRPPTFSPQPSNGD